MPQIILDDNTNGFGVNIASNSTWGTLFTVDQNIIISRIGVKFKQDSGGSQYKGVKLGIFDTTDQSLLCETVMTQAPTLVNNSWVDNDVTPTELIAGRQYMFAFVTDNQNYLETCKTEQLTNTDGNININGISNTNGFKYSNGTGFDTLSYPSQNLGVDYKFPIRMDYTQYTPPNLKVNVGGAWKDGEVYVKDGGAWTTNELKLDVNVGGVWKETI